ncbi:probable cytochrome P450 4d20 [Choristoneura fumiferana]|uniref:probable cytochrome P450 4d20 n=1 Tax=Choristoneura fumiferana TaxID=7141 RepID=UPI003D154CB3
MVYSLYCIANHPDVQRKVLEEQKEILGDDSEREPTYAELQQMKYLDCVIKESLRLYPSVPLIQRLMTKDIDVMGMNLTKNTSVILNIFHLQRHPDVYEDPLTFKPERFLKTTKAGNAYNWIPFSAGPRNCIGQKFAMMELKVTVAAIVRRFQLASSGIEPELCGALILKAKDGVTIKMKPRI